jgi:Tfp pilus assembly protein PilN
MIQLNLIPDVKSKYIQVERTKRLAILSAISVSALAILIVIVLAGVTYGTQKVSLNSLDKKIKSASTAIQNIDGLNKVLTIQNQLGSLTALHNQKPVTSRLFTYLPQITPSDVNISNISFRLDDNTVSITGEAPSLSSVNKFVDTIKFTEYKTDQGDSTQKAFSSVVLSGFSTSDKKASYTITAIFAPEILSGDFNNVVLVVPKITSTRSLTEQPDNLFKDADANSTNGQGN